MFGLSLNIGGRSQWAPNFDDYTAFLEQKHFLQFCTDFCCGFDWPNFWWVWGLVATVLWSLIVFCCSSKENWETNSAKANLPALARRWLS